jgi:hypothetical protein
MIKHGRAEESDQKAISYQFHCPWRVRSRAGGHFFQRWEATEASGIVSKPRTAVFRCSAQAFVSGHYSEDEIVQETLADHSFQDAEKWLQEICWRRYWKGWMEARPQVWKQYRLRLQACRKGLPKEALARAHAVMAGESGVDCMDRIARELIETGYLHNHARMWWASF